MLKLLLGAAAAMTMLAATAAEARSYGHKHRVHHNYSRSSYGHDHSVHHRRDLRKERRHHRRIHRDYR